MNLYLYALLTIIIASSAFASQQYAVGVLTLLLGMTGIFVYKNSYYPAVREWVERYF